MYIKRTHNVRDLFVQKIHWYQPRSYVAILQRIGTTSDTDDCDECVSSGYKSLKDLWQLCSHPSVPVAGEEPSIQSLQMLPIVMFQNRTSFLSSLCLMVREIVCTIYRNCVRKGKKETLLKKVLWQNEQNELFSKYLCILLTVMLFICWIQQIHEIWICNAL